VNAAVLDASAAAEIVVRTTIGRRLLALVPRDRTWWVPDHFHVETAGAIRRMLNNELVDVTRANAALERLLTLPVTVSRSQPLIAEAWTYRNNLIIHDAVYVVLARHLDAPLLTADRRIARAPQLPVRVLHISTAQ
jgi:predicted nucleic acid-binding protein